MSYGRCKTCRRQRRYSDEVVDCRECMERKRLPQTAKPEHQCAVFLCTSPARFRAWWVDVYAPGLCDRHMRDAAKTGRMDLGGGSVVEVPGWHRSGGVTSCDVHLYWPKRKEANSCAL